MELAAAIPLDGHDCSNFRTSVGKLIFMASWRPDMQFAIHQLSRKQARSEKMIQYLNGIFNTCLSLEPHNSVQKGMIELVGGGVSDWAGYTATRQSVTCNRSLEQTAIILSSCEAEFCGAGACAGALFESCHTTMDQRRASIGWTR